jgi:hypothetical protein
VAWEELRERDLSALDRAAIRFAYRRLRARIGEATPQQPALRPGERVAVGASSSRRIEDAGAGEETDANAHGS